MCLGDPIPLREERHEHRAQAQRDHRVGAVEAGPPAEHGEHQDTGKNTRSNPPSEVSDPDESGINTSTVRNAASWAAAQPPGEDDRDDRGTAKPRSTIACWPLLSVRGWLKNVATVSHGSIR